MIWNGTPSSQPTQPRASISTVRHFIRYTFFFIISVLGTEQTSTTSLLNLLLSKLGEVLGLHNDRDINLSVAQKLKHTQVSQVYNRSLSSSVLGSLIHTLSSSIEQLVNIDSRSISPVLHEVKVTHTDLTEVTRVIFIHEDAVVMLSSGITATTGMLTVLSDTTVTAGNVAALFSCFVEAGGHLLLFYTRKKVFGSRRTLFKGV
mmetsp:Transcript_25313/g.37716  ORF Transcript_25313/g.37716 Transcript_25313/m.37716 type:complete len:204 (+) Transcript_25313:109-720(+)